MLGSSFWATMALRLKASACRMAECMSAGNRSRIRPMVLGPLLAWMVPNTRWPVAVAHFAHQDDVGIFADGVLEGDLPVDDVESHLALVDDAFFIDERVLDGV